MCLICAALRRLECAAWAMIRTGRLSAVSNEQGGSGGSGGFGPKKPRATFGDVMLGIPSGGRSDERGGGRGGDRGRKPERERGEGRPEPRSAGGAEQRPPRGEQERGGRRQEPRKPQGPMVVIRRASGAVETLGAQGEQPAEAAAPAASEPTSGPAPSEAAPRERAPRRPQVTPAPSGALYEEVPESESFEQMFEASASKQGGMPQRRGPRVGAKVTGTIFQLGADTAFVNLGTVKAEAQIDLRELKDDEGILRYGVGDTLEAHVVDVGARGIVLSRALTRGNASFALLAEAAGTGIPVEGLVLSVNKGGLEVAVGDVRAFCPVSQIDVRFVEKPDQFVGEKLKFRVTEVRDRNVVLSRRALLEEELRAQAERVRATLEVGKVIRGKVVNVRDFGAFVDLGGLEGLIPVAELSHLRVGHPGEVVKVGDEVDVEVLRLEPAQPSSPDKAKHKERITLSLRALQEDPWKAATAELKEGDRLKGKVVRLQPFGAFVELRPGVDGLIHISALSERRIAHPRDVVQVGDEVWVAVEKVDPAEKRIGLRKITEEEAQQPYVPAAAKPVAAEAAAPRAKVGDVVTGKVDRIESYGIFLAFPGGKGLVPGAETGTERGTDYKRVFQLGQELRAQVIDVDASGKIKLSITGAQRAAERADMEAYLQSQPKAGGKGFGTFADLLKKHQK